MEFKELMETDIIPRVEKLMNDEKKHLHWLVDNNAPVEFIQIAQKYYFHYTTRLKEYKEFLLTLN